jgi:hypothetical protein
MKVQNPTSNGARVASASKVRTNAVDVVDDVDKELREHKGWMTSNVTKIRQLVQI